MRSFTFENIFYFCQFKILQIPSFQLHYFWVYLCKNNTQHVHTWEYLTIACSYNDEIFLSCVFVLNISLTCLYKTVYPVHHVKQLLEIQAQFISLWENRQTNYNFKIPRSVWMFSNFSSKTPYSILQVTKKKILFTIPL